MSDTELGLGAASNSSAWFICVRSLLHRIVESVPDSEESPSLLPNRLLLDKAVPASAATPAVEHLHELALLAGAHALEVDADVLEPADLLADGEGGRVDAAHEGADELAAQALEVGLEGEQLVVVLDEDALVAHRLLAHVL